MEYFFKFCNSTPTLSFIKSWMLITMLYEDFEYLDQLDNMCLIFWRFQVSYLVNFLPSLKFLNLMFVFDNIFGDRFICLYSWLWEVQRSHLSRCSSCLGSCKNKQHKLTTTYLYNKHLDFIICLWRPAWRGRNRNLSRHKE